MSRIHKLVIFGTIALAIAVVLGVESNSPGLTIMAASALALTLIAQTFILHRIGKKLRRLQA